MSRPTRFLVIGGGPAGSTAAAVAAAGGAQVTLVECEVVGGASQLRDCIPSKALVASADGLAAIRAGGHFGRSDPGPLRPDVSRLAERRLSVAALLSASVIGRLEALGVTLEVGRARLTGPGTAVVSSASGERTVEFDDALIATGSQPRVPAWAEVDGEFVLTSRQAYRLPGTPEHAVIVGAGSTGVEFAHIFSSLGAGVTLLTARERVLPRIDEEAAVTLEEEFAERGVVVLRGARARSARRLGSGVEVVTEDGRVVGGSHALLAVGLQPASEGLGLEAAGVAVEGEAIRVDARQRTSVPHIYAAGDVTGGVMLSSVAAAEGAVVGRLVLGEEAGAVDAQQAAQTVFTEPEIAWVGLQEAEAAAAGRRVRVSRAPFTANPRALIQPRPRGFVKVLSDPHDDVVLGGVVVGRNAAELIGILALAVRARLARTMVAETLMAYPSLAETISTAAR
ncbi:MAG: pyruvate/2-oxoglutarate dehydrogenase complex, dihydrolipoamide dehydrogenase component [Actinobacteria bacterium]|nr:pyruvate/2-oxoglutarate dehydrogenase complex, dihydrolipoamide dehydrogenase component [Actinomycetota bacterium]